MIKKGDKFNIKHEKKGEDWVMSGPYECLYVKNIPPSDSFILAYRDGEGDIIRKRNVEDCVKVTTTTNGGW